MIKIKRILIISVILVTIISLCIYSLVYLKNYTEDISASLSSANSKADIEEVLKNWDKEKKKIGLFVHEDAVNEITDSIESCYSNYGTEFFETEIKKTTLSLRELYENELPTFYNVF